MSVASGGIRVSVLIVRTPCVDPCRGSESRCSQHYLLRGLSLGAPHRHLHGQVDGAAHRFRAGDDERESALVAVDQVQAGAAMGEREQRVVASWGEHVLEGKRAKNLFAR